MEKRKIKLFLISIFLFVCLLYGFIPFETSNTLLTHSIHGAALALILIFALIKSKIKIKLNIFGRITLFIIALFTLISLLRSFDKNAIIFIYSIIFGSIIANIIRFNENFKRQFLESLKWLIFVSIAMLMLQKIVLSLTGNIIRIHEMFYPFSKARISFNESFSDLYRMGGLYIEPGTYSNMMYLFLIIYLVLSKNISNPIIIIGAISIILSYSVWGMLSGGYLLVIIMLNKINKSAWKGKILALAVIVSLGFLTNYIANGPEFNYAIEKLNSEEESVVSKEQVYKKYVNSFDSFLIIGEGFLPPFETGLTAFQDSGLLLNISVVFGICFSILIFILFSVTIIKCCNWIVFFASLPIFVSKLFYFDASFWLLFFILIFAFSKKKVKKIIISNSQLLKI